MLNASHGMKMEYFLSPVLTFTGDDEQYNADNNDDDKFWWL